MKKVLTSISDEQIIGAIQSNDVEIVFYDSNFINHEEENYIFNLLIITSDEINNQFLTSLKVHDIYILGNSNDNKANRRNMYFFENEDSLRKALFIWPKKVKNNQDKDISTSENTLNMEIQVDQGPLHTSITGEAQENKITDSIETFDCNNAPPVNIKDDFPSTEYPISISHFSTNKIEAMRKQYVYKGNNGAYAFVVAYVNNRAIQNRLDEVFGIGGWKNSYVEFSGGIICELSCYINGQWITKSDGSEPSNFEAFKGGLSNAMKRAAVQFGIGRYLYKLEPIYVKISETKSNNSIYLNDKKNKVVGYYDPPRLPDWALPPNEQKQGKNKETTSTTDNNNKKREIDKKTGNNNFNRNSYFISITEFINKINLKPRAAMELFHHINSDTKSDCVEIKDIKEKATDKELIKYYDTLKPVSDLVKMSIHYKIPVENVLNYVRILKPQEKIDSLHSCLIRLNREDIKEINGFIEGDIKNNMFEHQTA